MSTVCTNYWCYFKGNPTQVMKPPADTIQPMATVSPGSCVPPCKKLVNGVAAVFFTTLEWCSCVYTGTIDDTDDDTNQLPLIRSNEHLPHQQQIMGQAAQKIKIRD